MPSPHSHSHCCRKKEKKKRQHLCTRKRSERENLPQLLSPRFKLFQNRQTGRRRQVMEQRIALPLHLYSAFFPSDLFSSPFFPSEDLNLTHRAYLVKSDVFPSQTFTFKSSLHEEYKKCSVETWKKVPKLRFIDSNSVPLWRRNHEDRLGGRGMRDPYLLNRVLLLHRCDSDGTRGQRLMHVDSSRSFPVNLYFSLPYTTCDCTNVFSCLLSFCRCFLSPAFRCTYGPTSSWMEYACFSVDGLIWIDLTVLRPSNLTKSEHP